MPTPQQVPPGRAGVSGGPAQRPDAGETPERALTLGPGFRRTAVATTVASLLLVAVGGAVRATDSGLACPDWPRCYGRWVPAADLNMWLEHSHRLLAGVVVAMVGVLASWALARHRGRRDLLWPALGAFALVTAQAGLGALVVLRLLRAELVTAHLGMAMAVVACLLYLTVNAYLPRRRDRLAAGAGLARDGVAVAGLTYVQILVGGHVTGIGAGLAFDLEGFPLYSGAVLPAVTSPQEAFHVAHRSLALLLVAAVAWLCVRALRYRRRLAAAGLWTGPRRWLLRLPLVAAGLVVVQVLLGVANVANGLSFLTVIPHLAVASWIWALLVLGALLAHRLAPEPGRVSRRDGAARTARLVPSVGAGERP
ncbi:MAG TPA: COX15/CtaA family protein [Egibacteraceae bacterium]|nr:COX15/CtaA family protein [Egibacteraceae bacterium]